MQGRSKLALASALLLAGAFAEDSQQRGHYGVGTLRRGQTRREEKPQWLQDRLIARAAEKRARKNAQRVRTRDQAT